MKREPFNILFTNVGRRVSLIRAFRETMNRMGLTGKLIGVDANPLSPAYYVTDSSFPICPIHSQDYIPSLLDICRREKVKLLISLLDTDLVKLSENKDIFQNEDIFVLISSLEVILLSRNKRITSDFFKQNAIPTPRILDYETALAENSFPLFIKPIDGSASHKTFLIENREALSFFYQYVPNPLILEYISGAEYTLDLFIGLNKEVKGLVPRKRLEVRAGEVSKSQIVLNPEIMAAGRRVAEALAQKGALGPLNVQCIHSHDHGIQFIEINPRFGGGCPLSIHAGYPFPQWSIETALGIALSPIENNLGDGEIMLRYDEAIFIRH
jgi:carbamoyl-phosphate synthase large subunit